MSVKFIPFGDRILIEQVKEANKANLILDDEAVKRRPIGVVLKLGDGYAVQSSRLREGNTIVFLELYGEKVKVGEKELLVINLKDVLGRLYDEP